MAPANCGSALILLIGSTVSLAEPVQFKTERFCVVGDTSRQYSLLGPKQSTAPERGYGLIVALAPGDGGTAHLPLLQRLYNEAIPDTYLLVQPIVAPSDAQAVTTDRFVSAVIWDVSNRFPVNSEHVFLLAWSTAGPAAYRLSAEIVAIKGTIIAMAPFDAAKFPGAERVRGKPYVLIHPRNDLVYPFEMAAQAEDNLRAQGARVQMLPSEGGHGWRTAVYPIVQQGIAWLENPAQPIATEPYAVRDQATAGGAVLPLRQTPQTQPSAQTQPSVLDQVIGVTRSAGTVRYIGPRDPLTHVPLWRPVPAPGSIAGPPPATDQTAEEQPPPRPAKPFTTLQPLGTRYQLRR